MTLLIDGLLIRHHCLYLLVIVKYVLRNVARALAPYAAALSLHPYRLPFRAEGNRGERRLGLGQSYVGPF